MGESDLGFMREALAQAQQGLEADDAPIGAVAVLDGGVISSAHWRYRPDGLLDHPDTVVLRVAERDPRVRGRRRDVTLYVTLEPCLMCMGSAASFGVGRIVYAMEAPLDGAHEVLRRWQPRLGHPPPGLGVYSVPAVVGGVCAEEALAQWRLYVDRHPDVTWAKAMLLG